MMRRWLPVFLMALGGCTMGPDYIRPEIQSPVEYRDEIAPDESIANLPWFELYNDSVLVNLIDTALRENRDLRVSVARIDEAAATLGIVRADLFPRVDYGGSAFIDGNSAEDWETSGSASGFLGVSWQVDLWGRIRRSNEAALQTLLATEESVRGVTVSLVAGVASSYLLLRDLDNRLLISEETVEIRRQNFDIIKARFDGGSVTGVDLNQALIQLAEAEVSIQVFTRLRRQVENSLSVLMGRPPMAIPRGLDLREQIAIPELPPGLPSGLLERRPDILVAERELHAQTARIGVAEALKFPQFDLTASLGGAVADVNTGFFDLGAQVFGPIFNSGENQRRVEAEEARTWQLLARYEQTILNAWREVEDALIATSTYEAELAARMRQVEAATDAAHLAWVRYEGGMTSYLEILETQRSLFGAQLAESETRQLRLNAIVELYAALGGGWYEAPPSAPMP
jgi:multidrug efflux system outer membrane protein